MLDVVLPIGVLAMLLLFVAQLRRLIEHAILNRTIRKAMEVDPASAHLLIAKLESRSRWADSLGGWILLVTGAGLAIAALFDDSEARVEIFQIATIASVIGIGMLVYAWWVERNTRSFNSAPPPPR